MLPATLHRNIYLVLLALLGGTMVCSTWAANLVWVLMGVNWLLEGRWSDKWQRLRSSRLLHLYVAYCAVLAVAMAWTSNVGFGLHVLQVSLPLLVVPLVVLTSPAATGQARSTILWVYAMTVAVVAVIAVVRIATIEGLPYRDAVPYISHIRFALNCCMVAIICLGRMRRHGAGRWAAAVLALFMVAFLVLLRSFTGLAVLALVSLVLTLVYARHWWSVGLWVVAAAVAAIAVGHEVHSYYRLAPLAEQPLAELTANGRPYRHACDGIIENGNYINNYICKEELQQEWEQRSALPYNSLTDEGYDVEPTLVRYLNALGLTKDSAGVAALTDKQIAAVERGVANPVYEEGNQLRKMVYVLLFEREYYVHTNAVKGFTLIQRLELWGATLDVIGQHPWLGAGTGDAIDEMHLCLELSGSELSGTNKHTHNQYLTLLAMTGGVGFAIVAFFAARAIVGSRSKRQSSERRRRPSALMLAWALAAAISFLTEDTLDTLAGILFCTWFLAFRRQDQHPS